MEIKHNKAQLPLLTQTFSAKLYKRKKNNKISRNINLTESNNNLHFNTYAHSNKSSNITTYRSPPQMNAQSLFNKMFFTSYDKTTQLTVGSSGLDLSLSNLAKFKRLNVKQLSNKPIKTKPLTNLKLYHTRDNQLMNKPHHQKASSVFYLTKGLKTNNNIFTNNRPPGNVMNIVNNLNGSSLDQGGNNKNVEINFNKYEIKILSNKQSSNQSLNDNVKSPKMKTLSKDLEEPMEEQIEKERLDIQYSTKAYENKLSKEIALKQVPSLKQSTKRSLVQKSSYTDYDNESSDLTSSNFICMKQPMKETKVLRLINRNNYKPQNLVKTVSLIPKTQKEIMFAKSENVNNDNNDKIEDSNIAIIKEENIKCTVIKPYSFSDLQIASHECNISFHEKEPSNDGPILKIIDSHNSNNEEDLQIHPENQDNDQEKMNDFLSANLESKIINNKQLIISPNKPKFIVRLSQSEEINNLSLIAPNKNKETNQEIQENLQDIFDSSHDSSLDEVRNKNKKTSFENKVKFNCLKINSEGQTLTNEPVNGSISSTKNSSINFQSKDNSVYGFLLKKATTTLLLSPRKKNHSLDVYNSLKLRRHLSPKKNKRFLKQLSKISENYHPLLLNQHEKHKLCTSSSLPNISSMKISDDLHVCPSRQVSQKLLGDKLLNYINHPEKVVLMKRASIIKEERYESVSSREEDRDETLYKKGSMRSNTTNSVQCVDLKKNTIKINIDYAKCPTLSEKPYCQSFMQKLLSDLVEYKDDIEENASETKKDLIMKTTACIDIKNDKLEDQRKRTLTKYATETLIQSFTQRKVNIEDFLINTNDNYEKRLNEEMSQINEYDYYHYINHYYIFSLSSVIIAPLSEKYFEINLLYHLQKEKYLDTDYSSLGASFIVNFSKKRKLIKRLRTSSCNSMQSNEINYPNIYTVHTRKRTKLKSPHGINSYFCFRFVTHDKELDNFDDDDEKPITIHLRKKKSTTIKKSVRKRESKMNVNGMFKKRTTMFKKQSTSKLSFNSGRTFEDMNFQRNDTILHKRFYSRHRDTIGNEEPDINDSLYINNLALSRRKEELFMSPLNRNEGKRSTVRKPTLIANKLLIFNKETVMSQTHEIKSRILTEMKNYVDSLFFYIKDGNYQNFKDIFLKYKVDTEIKDQNGNTFLNTAVQCDSSKITIFLLDNGANVNTQNRRLNTPLHYALCYQNYSLADILIKSGADEELKNRLGMTAWQCINSASTNI